MKIKCIMCRKQEFNLDRRKSYFKGDFVIVCKKCSRRIADYSSIKIVDRKSKLFGKTRLYGANIIIREGDKFYLSSCYCDYNLRLTNKSWATILFRERNNPLAFLGKPLRKIAYVQKKCNFCTHRRKMPVGLAKNGRLMCEECSKNKRNLKKWFEGVSNGENKKRN